MPEVLPVDDLLRQVDPDGRLAPCRLEQVLLGPDAVDAVADTVAALLTDRGHNPSRLSTARVALLIDPVAKNRDGDDLTRLVRDQLNRAFEVLVVVLDDGEPELHVSDEVVAKARVGVAGADAVVALGGGTVSDIGKLAADADTVLVTVMTAASVDGYTDDVSVILRDGVKRTVSSRWPDAVVADTTAISDAPDRLNTAGFGEMTSMLTAPADWRLAALTGVDTSYAEAPVRLLDLVGGELQAWAAGISTAEPNALEALSRALCLRGVVTGVAGTTAVLSGVEHLISHMLDQHHASRHSPIGLHGAQVGVGATIAAACWEHLSSKLSSEQWAIEESALDPAVAEARVHAAFDHLGAAVAAECLRDYRLKTAAMAAQLGTIRQVLDNWSKHADELQRLVRPTADLSVMLRAAQAAATPAELNPAIEPELWHWAVANCALMRNRFTVVDLLGLLGWWTTADVDAVIARAANASRELV